MSALRQQIIQHIYRNFEQWTEENSLSFACHKGCATCCTQNVTMTAVEGDCIHGFINKHNMQNWLVEKLQAQKTKEKALETTNEFAGKCLAGQESSRALGHEERQEASCPFLEDNDCKIYPVRPFTCRSFASAIQCQPGLAAEQPPYYISATTAAQQLIEHVGQGEYWGNMLDVLLALCDLDENEQTAEMLPSKTLIDEARARVTKAKPLPGFLIGAEDYERVSPFIEAIFNVQIGEKTVEDILNGK